MCFAGELVRKILCFNCFEVNSMSESFFELSLGIEKQFKSLEDSVHNFFDCELIEDDYDCNKCRNRAPACSKIFISQRPQYLCLHLMRFQYLPAHIKIDQQLKPLWEDTLDLRRYPFLPGL